MAQIAPSHSTFAAVSGASKTAVKRYDLGGRRVKSSIFNSQSSILKKGVIIVDGKKVVNK